MPKRSEAPPWLPDWHDTAGYPDPNSLPGTSARWRWRWEFQRRDPAYQRDWAERADHPRSFWHERYGLKDPVDPASPTASYLEWPLYWIQPHGAGDRTLAIRQRAGTVLIQLDLSRPLHPQFKGAEFSLQPWTVDEADLKKAEIVPGFLVMPNRRRGKGFYWRPNDWVRYLRLLDARARGASRAEIVGVLYPNLSNDYPERSQDNHWRDDRRRAGELLRGRHYTLF
jgi:hypothetical protein